MVAPLIPALIQLAPTLIGLFTDDPKASTVAEIASDVARAVTGEDNDDDALTALNNDPKLLIEYQRATADEAIALYREETKRLQSINKTIRAEVTSSDPYVRRMRPTWGYVMAATWSLIMVVIGRDLWEYPGMLTQTLPHIVTLFGLGLAVLGVYVHGRTREKSGKKGGILGDVLSKFGGAK